MTGYQFFHEWWLDGCYENGTPEYAYWHEPVQVRRAAIDASYASLHQAAIELKEHAIAIMTQTERNFNDASRHAEQKMVAIVDGNWRRYNGE